MLRSFEAVITSRIVRERAVLGLRVRRALKTLTTIADVVECRDHVVFWALWANRTAPWRGIARKAGQR